MKTCGIIVEYNPFHNGHWYHIREARKLTQCDCLIAVMSGNFTQRGEPAIVDKFQRTEVALLHGVDLLIELPHICVVQNASIFGETAVHLLKMLKVDTIVFGSETGNLKELKTIADLPINVEYLKERLREGESYPKAYGLLADYIYPNDRLAVSYLRALKDSSIKAFALKRTSQYNSHDIHKHASASAIRNSVFSKKDYRHSTPMIINDAVRLADLYPYLRRTLLLEKRENLQERFLVKEGIEKLMRDSASRYQEFEEFMKACVNKRYTRSRIQRTALQIMLHNTTEEVSHIQKPTYLRILGFNDIGRSFVNGTKHQLHYITSLKEIPLSYKIFEERAMYLYASLFEEDKRKELIKKELSGPVIIKKNAK